jgi:Zn-dependent M28 family amino/carboxypeptidase
MFSRYVPTLNVAAEIKPVGEPARRVVICAHLDTHRTPRFFSSPAWLRLFTYLVGGALVSMAAGFILFALAAVLEWGWMRWGGLPLGSLQAFALAMVASADRTPFTPGANDNASGVAVALALAGRLQSEPLSGTAVTILFTDCEETGAHGAAAYLEKHRAELDQAVFIALDQVGAGAVKYLAADGLLFKHRTHPRALALARAAAQKLPQVAALEMAGLAYTDALPFTKAGLAALTLCCVPRRDPAAGTHWHQVSDTLEFIERSALADITAFTWQVLQEIDQPA